MGCEAPPSPQVGGASSSSSSPNGKRPRDPDDEIYLDNFHSQKRYLSEIMASSLNGLKVGDSHSVPETLMDSPARYDVMGYFRDEMCSEYSMMSEDSDDSSYFDTPFATSMSQSDVSRPTSPVSPQSNQKMVGGLSSTSSPYPLPGCTLASVVCSHPRQRGSDSECRFPSSPNDMCHTADLRKAALLRSVQMRAQPPFNNGQESTQCGEVGTYPEIKNSVDDEEYEGLEQVPDLVVECSSENCLSDNKLGRVGNSVDSKCGAERERMA